ncbi:hypothetical protein FRC01_007776 [Tulasnella sp. 417]|nr:hypothetical protein FRC01_007776 [Tulasnella sp. 417]
MAQAAGQINAAAIKADLARRGNGGIALVTYRIRPNHPTIILLRWSHHKRNVRKFSVWLSNVRTPAYYKVFDTGWNSESQNQVKLSALNLTPGEYELVLTKWNDISEVYAKSGTFTISSSDLS